MTTHPRSAVSVADSLQRLTAAQKSSKGAPLYSVLVNRPMGRFFAALAHQVGLTPNGVTAISAVFTFTGIVVLALADPTWAAAAIVTGCLVLGYGLDAADGQLARLRGGGSLLGEWLDHVIDSFKIATLHVAVLLTVYWHYDLPRAWLWLPLVFGVVSIVHFFGFLLTELLTRIHYLQAGDPLPPKGRPSMLMSFAKLPTDYGLLCWVFLLLPLGSPFLVVYGSMALAMTVYTLLVLVKWAAGIQRLEGSVRS